ncbi:hypothetical protein [Vibrio parahaemolyticus]|uniref:hypothetical protein n=1 Tax=Vibrio parahaemolyticus TaxID=670 RepID=UPI000B795F27|nr:hypothetical protein [Vibrio parahaemolyticus]OXD33820.1 hypothetical protein CA162_11420 [Vibrio parahaemolyticus]
MQAQELDSDEQRLWELVWNTRLGIRYHLYAQSHYQKLAKFVTIFTLFASSAAFAVVLNKNENLAAALALIAAFLQIFDLVIDTKSKATTHSTLRQKYLQLEVSLQRYDRLTIEDADQFNRTRASIELEEPPLIRSLMTYVHNEQVRVEWGENSERQVKLDWWTSLKIRLLPF